MFYDGGKVGQIYLVHAVDNLFYHSDLSVQHLVARFLWILRFVYMYAIPIVLAPARHSSIGGVP